MYLLTKTTRQIDTTCAQVQKLNSHSPTTQYPKKPQNNSHSSAAVYIIGTIFLSLNWIEFNLGFIDHTKPI